MHENYKTLQAYTATLLIAHDVVAFAALPLRETSQASTTTSNTTSINVSEILIDFVRRVPHESADAFIVLLPNSFFSRSSVSRFARVSYLVRSFDGSRALLFMGLGGVTQR